MGAKIMASDATEKGRERGKNETGAATMEKLRRRREEGEGRKKIQEEERVMR